jgi:Na+-driven multidrug efflux pump
LGLPGLGIAGAPLAASIANALACAINSRVLFSSRSRLHLRLSDYRFEPALLQQMLRLGVPSAINGAERSIAQLVLVGLVTPFGDNALAAFTLSRRTEMFANLGSQGFGQASGVIVGQNLGANQPSRARKTIYWALGYVAAVKTVMTVLLFAFPQLFLLLFTRDQELIDLASTWIRIQCLGLVAMGASQVFMQSFMTAGSTLFPMMVNLITIWGVQQPLAHLLTQTSLEQYGVAWAAMLALSSRLLFYVPFFLSGRWLRARVFSDRSLQAEAPLSPQRELSAGTPG